MYNLLHSISTFLHPPPHHHYTNHTNHQPHHRTNMPILGSFLVFYLSVLMRSYQVPILPYNSCQHSDFDSFRIVYAREKETIYVRAGQVLYIIVDYSTRYRTRYQLLGTYLYENHTAVDGSLSAEFFRCANGGKDYYFEVIK